MKLGRNDPCYCGSGKKYKKCHLRPSAGMWEEVVKRAQAEKQRIERYGNVRPILHARVQGHKIVAVGDEIHWSESWRTFPDFLYSYIRTLLGSDWGNSEISKPFAERNQILQWYDGHCRFQASIARGKDGLYRSAPNGVAAAYLFLAYDLYILRHHGALQKDVIKRLKIKEQFQGARYELFVAATLIRAGFDLRYENEKDGSRKHPEFIAVHRETGERVAVEAKSRHRSGVLGFRGGKVDTSNMKAGVTALLDDAILKVNDKPLVIFIDLNLPPSPGQIFEKPWYGEIVEMIGQKDDEFPENHPYNMLVITNIPHHYGAEDELAPSRDILIIVSQKPRVPLKNLSLLRKIDEAVHKCGNIPNEFPTI